MWIICQISVQSDEWPPAGQKKSTDWMDYSTSFTVKGCVYLFFIASVSDNKASIYLLNTLQIKLIFQVVRCFIASETHFTPLSRSESKSRLSIIMCVDSLLICCTVRNVGLELKYWAQLAQTLSELGLGAHISNPANTLLNWVSTKTHFGVCNQHLVFTTPNTMLKHSLLCLWKYFK